VGDTETDRPLIILIHTGNFLVPQANGGCGGTIKDNDMINFATQLTEKGYVVAVIDYRIGWNPVNPDQPIRSFFLLNASYRGIQDTRTAVRFFKRSVAQDGNPFGIDPGKIGMWGFGTGGYIVYGSTFLNDVEDTFIPKFFFNDTTPMVQAPINGDINATTLGIVPANYPGNIVEEGDTLCIPNHVGFSSEFQLGISAGGANGDDSWINDEDTTPFIAFQVETDTSFSKQFWYKRYI